MVLPLAYKARFFLQLMLFWWVLEGGCVPIGSLCWRQAHGRTCMERWTHAGVGLLAGPVVTQGSHLCLKDCTLWKDPMLG